MKKIILIVGLSTLATLKEAFSKFAQCHKSELPNSIVEVTPTIDNTYYDILFDTRSQQYKPYRTKLTKPRKGYVKRIQRRLSRIL